MGAGVREQGHIGLADHKKAGFLRKTVQTVR
jgi:hypothetical protein